MRFSKGCKYTSLLTVIMVSFLMDADFVLVKNKKAYICLQIRLLVTSAFCFVMFNMQCQCFEFLLSRLKASL